MCSTTCSQFEEAQPIENLPPSAKLVYLTLRYEGGLTQQELATHTMLPQRTVRFALTRLREEAIVEEQIYWPDTRKRQYVLAGEA